MTKKNLSNCLEEISKVSTSQAQIAQVLIPLAQDELCKKCKDIDDIYLYLDIMITEAKQLLACFSEVQRPDNWWDITNEDVLAALMGRDGKHDGNLSRRCVWLAFA